MKTAFLSHPDFQLHDTGPSHPERPERMIALDRFLHQTGLWDTLTHLEFEPVTDQQLEWCHIPAHIQHVRELAEQGGGHLDGDTWVSPDSFRVAKLAVGAAVRGVDAVIGGEVSNAFCAVRPPGHHAESGRRPQSPWGFCLFNSVAVAARHAQVKHGLKRVAIVDFDVHHGNGTQEIFESDPTVFFASVHEWGIFPNSGHQSERGIGPGEGTTLNIPLPSNSDGRVYAMVWDQVGLALRKFEPELIILSAGYDAHIGDPLAHMALTALNYAALVTATKLWATEMCGGRLVVVQEGGYNLGALAECVDVTLRVLQGD